MSVELQTNNTGWKNITKIIIPYILIVGIFQYLGYIAVGLNINGLINEKSTFQFFFITIFDFLGTVFIVWLFGKYVDKESFKRLGFETSSSYFTKDILLGLIIGFIIMAADFLILLAFNQIQFKGLQYNMSDLMLSIGIFTIVALSEELLIRGYVLSNLMASCNKYLALIISSIIFSLMHGLNPNINWFGFIDLFLAGILLGGSYIYTKNLWFPIALHFSWNFFQGTIFGFNVSGLNGYSIIIIGHHQNTIWNGGAFGFEGSVLSILFQLIAIIIVFVIFKKREIKDREDIIPEVSLANL